MLAFLCLAACATGSPEAPATLRRLDAEIVRLPMDKGPPATPADACWGQEVAPAVIETVTEQVQVAPAKVDATGTVIRPASYRSTSRQKIVQERAELWFPIPCMKEFPPDFVASLQRALSVRGYYGGPVTGTFDSATAQAVRRFQTSRGLNSAQLSRGAARELGLIGYGADG